MTDARLRRWSPVLRRALMKARPEYLGWSREEQERYGCIRRYRMTLRAARSVFMLPVVFGRGEKMEPRTRALRRHFRRVKTLRRLREDRNQRYREPTCLCWGTRVAPTPIHERATAYQYGTTIGRRIARTWSMFADTPKACSNPAHGVRQPAPLRGQPQRAPDHPRAAAGARGGRLSFVASATVTHSDRRRRRDPTSLALPLVAA
jgi:hypothetical protein